MGSAGGTPVIDNTTPTFAGKATPGYAVAIMALSDGSSAAVQVGRTTAGTDGAWRTTTTVLSDGGYSFYVRAFNPGLPLRSSQSVPIGRVVIETHGPRVASITPNARNGVFDISFVDAVGLDVATLLDPADYTLTAGARTLHPTAVAVVTGQTVAVTFGKATKLKPGKYTLTIDSALITNQAGVNLDGEFRGALPSGNGVPGGEFQALFTVHNNNRRTVSGPAPVVVTLGSTHPRKTRAREFAARIASRVPRVV
jgi:hypothetical protein